MSGKRVALVVGGGSGMGAGAARRLIEEGFQVGILTSSGKGEAIAAKIGGMAVRGSNRSNEDLQGFVDTVVEKWGRIDAVVSSAGHGPKGLYWRFLTRTGTRAWSSISSMWSGPPAL